MTYVRGTDDYPSVHHRFWCQDFAYSFSNHCCERGGIGGWHSRDQVFSNLLVIKAGLLGAELQIVVCSDKFVGTANRKPPFGVPTIFVGTVVPTNLSEQPIGNQFSVPTILLGTALFPQRLWEHHVVPSFW